VLISRGRSFVIMGKRRYAKGLFEEFLGRKEKMRK
jgi:hypothetical protein